MSLSIKITALNPDSISLGKKTIVSVEYRVGANPSKEVDVSFTSQGSFTIFGKSSFSHTVGQATRFTQDLELTGTSPNSQNTLKLTAMASGEDSEEDTRTIEVSGEEALILLRSASVTASAFSKLKKMSFKRGFVYKLLKENGFQYNPSTKKWDKQ